MEAFAASAEEQPDTFHPETDGADFVSDGLGLGWTWQVPAAADLCQPCRALTRVGPSPGASSAGFAGLLAVGAANCSQDGEQWDWGHQ